MLNAELVENFHAIFRQKKTGALNVAGDDHNVRFLFQDGEVMAMDLGEDKEHLLADKLQEYHRLDQAQHALVFATKDKVQGNVADIVRNLHLASDDEVAQITRAMVEDALCGIFGDKVRSIQFNPQQGMESFNFERSAVRLRIPVETLLNTVDKRVAEIQDVRKAVGDWDSVFAFAEGSEDAGALSDYEKHVLNFVDGHRTVEDIASACRDSSLNLARVLHGLTRKSVVRKLPPKMKASMRTPAGGITAAPGALAAAPAAAASVAPAMEGAAPAPAPAAAAPMPQTYTTLPPQPEESGPNWLLRIAVLAVVALAIGLLFLVKSYNDRQREFAQRQTEINGLVIVKDWNQALAKLEELRTQAGNDVSAQEGVNQLANTVQAEMAKELVEIGKLVDSGEFDQARSRLNRLPPSDDEGKLHSRLTAGEEAFNQASAKLAAEVSAALDNGDIVAANKLIESRSAREGAAAANVRDRWRVKKLDDAGSPGASIEERQRAVKLVRDAKPSPDQMQKIALIEDDIRRQAGRLRDQIKELQDMADKGDYEGALAKAEKLGTGTVVKGNPELDRAFQAFQSKCDAVKRSFAQLHDDARDAVANGENADKLRGIADRGDQLLTSYPAASRGEDTKRLVALLRDVIDAVSQPADVQPSLISQLKDTRQIDPELRTALDSRMNRLSANESEANIELENARRLLKDGNLDAAERRYNDLIRKPEWQTTAAHRSAEKELAEAQVQGERRQAAQKELSAAIAAGEVSKANDIAREIGLKYLPLSIDSVPTGAEVWQGGKKVGTTPLVLDISAADRVDYTAELRLPGYVAKTVSGASAEGGWRVQAELERAPAAQADLGQVVTSRPTVLGARLWVANRSQAFAITPAGKFEDFVYQGPAGPSPLNNPIYAAAVSGSEGVYIASRDNVAVIVGKTVGRAPLGGGTDFGVALFESPELIDSRFLIVAGTDGALHGVEEHRPTQRWDGPAGAPYACAPLVLGETLLAVRSDGSLEQYRPNDGAALGSTKLGAAVVAAWPTATGFAGITANEAWTWEGDEIVRTQLPQTAVAGAKDVIVGVNGRVWLRADQDWKDLGRVDGTVTGDPLVWQGHVAVPMGSTMRVIGPRGFTTTTPGSDYLPAANIGPRLFVINQNGHLAIYDP